MATRSTTKTEPTEPTATTGEVSAPSEESPAETFEDFGSALAAFQRYLPSVRKNHTADVRSDKGSYKYDYADLTDVSEAVLPALGRVGLAFHTGLDTDEQGNIMVTWELIHGASGTGRTGRLPAGRAGTNWQTLGSAITYARRYALAAATGVAPGGDDDDALASVGAGDQNQRPTQRQAPPQAPVQSQPQRLPAGLYDLSALTYEGVKDIFRRARAAGHLDHLIGVPDESGAISEIRFEEYLIATGQALAPAPSESPAEDNPDAKGDDAEAAERAAIEDHEREAADQAAVAEATESSAAIAEKDGA